jgi:hypothetical protein
VLVQGQRQGGRAGATPPYASDFHMNIIHDNSPRTRIEKVVLNVVPVTNINEISGSL